MGSYTCIQCLPGFIESKHGHCIGEHAPLCYSIFDCISTPAAFLVKKKRGLLYCKDGWVFLKIYACNETITPPRFNLNLVVLFTFALAVFLWYFVLSYMYMVASRRKSKHLKFSSFSVLSFSFVPFLWVHVSSWTLSDNSMTKELQKRPKTT